jgi:hypothetical protein
MAQLRNAFMRAAVDAGMSEADIKDALQHAHVTIKTGHSVVYPGQGGPQDFSSDAGSGAGIGPQPAFPWEAADQTGLRRQRLGRTLKPVGTPGGRWSGGNVLGAIAGVIGGVIGASALLMVFVPSASLWTSGIVCRSGYHLAPSRTRLTYTPYQWGPNGPYHWCVSGVSSYPANEFVILGLVSLLVALVLCPAVVVGVLMWRGLRTPR